MNWPQIFFWAMMAVEAVILVWFAGYAFVHVVPWETMRQRKAATAELKKLMPALIERCRAAVLLTETPRAKLRVASVKETQRQMGEDAGRLAKLCLTLLETMNRDWPAWPVGALSVAHDAASTLDMVEKLCTMRDTRLPDLERRLVVAAAEQARAAEALRLKVWLRATEFADQGVPLGYELHCLKTLANGIAAYVQLAPSVPDEVAKKAKSWTDRTAAIAESVEIRAGIWKRIAVIRQAYAGRVTRIRELRALLAPQLFGEKAAKVTAGKAGERLSALAAVDAMFERAAAEMQKAEEGLNEPAVDVGASNSSAKRLIAALHSAELANALLAGFESDLDLLVAAMAAHAAGQKGSN